MTADERHILTCLPLFLKKVQKEHTGYTNQLPAPFFCSMPQQQATITTY
jgi:hypothetical protein